MMSAMTRKKCDPYQTGIVPGRLRGWGAGAVVFGLGAALAAGAMPALAGPSGAPSGAPWEPGAALAATGLNSETVGFHAGRPAAQDAAAMPRHADKRTIVDVTSFGANPTGKADSAKAV